METTTVNEMPSIEEEDLFKCGCIAKPTTGWRVLRTQNKGQILEHPIVIGNFDSINKATDAAVEARRVSGSFAVILPVYECGHDHSQWVRCVGNLGD